MRSMKRGSRGLSRIKSFLACVGEPINTKKKTLDRWTARSNCARLSRESQARKRTKRKTKKEGSFFLPGERLLSYWNELVDSASREAAGARGMS